jgi:hypothetical protein
MEWYYLAELLTPATKTCWQFHLQTTVVLLLMQVEINANSYQMITVVFNDMQNLIFFSMHTVALWEYLPQTVWAHHHCLRACSVAPVLKPATYFETGMHPNSLPNFETGMAIPSSFKIARFWKMGNLAGAGFKTGATEWALRPCRGFLNR